MNEIVDLLRQLESGHFYGTLEVKMEAGHVMVVRKTESIKPQSARIVEQEKIYRTNRRENNGNAFSK